MFLEFAHWLAGTQASLTVQTVKGLVQFLQSVHILMLGLVFGSVLMLALRVLGRIRTDETLREVWERFSRWLWTGVTVMAATGLVLVVGEPVREFSAHAFWLKMLLLAIGLASTAAFGRRVKAVADSQGDAALAASLRPAAIATLVLWLLVIFLGRAIAYDAEVWSLL